MTAVRIDVKIHCIQMRDGVEQRVADLFGHVMSVSHREVIGNDNGQQFQRHGRRIELVRRHLLAIYLRSHADSSDIIGNESADVADAATWAARLPCTA